MSNLFEAAGATFSSCRTYRWRLWRIWDPGLPLINFLMLNPSTADELVNDPTVERCQRRAIAGDFGGLIVTNLFALRSTDPIALYRHDDPVGRDNDHEIIWAAHAAELVVCAWGKHGARLERGRRVLAMLREAGVTPHALKVNGDGSPCHPLYLPYDLKPVPMEVGR